MRMHWIEGLSSAEIPPRTQWAEILSSLSNEELTLVRRACCHDTELSLDMSTEDADLPELSPVRAIQNEYLDRITEELKRRRLPVNP
jgi:hypothetical protein